MRHYCRLIPAAIAIILLAASAAAANGPAVTAELHSSEWTWEEKNIAMFEGSVSSENALPEKVLLRLSFTVSPGQTDTDAGEMVFSAVNGKKLTIRKQKPEITADTGGSDRLTFSGSWKTPERMPFTKAEIHLRVYGEDESTLLAEKKMTVSRDASELVIKDDGKFRIRENFTEWTTAAAAAAILIWIAALARIVLVHRQKGKVR